MVGMGEINVGAAIKELRGRLGLTQGEFAKRIDRTLNTVARYENQVKPGVEAVVVCGALAQRSGFADLADIFRESLVSTLGVEVEDLLKVGGTGGETSRVSSSVRVPKDLEPLVVGFIRFMTASGLSKLEEVIRQAVRGIVEDRYMDSSRKVRRSQ